MAYSTLSVKSKPAGPAQSLRINPSNSPSIRPPTRSSNKPSLFQSALSLQTVIGTTTTTPNGFSYHDQSKSFAFCAGSAGVLAELDDDDNVNQRFFRARPTANSINPITSFYNQSTPPTTPDNRAKSLPGVKATPLNGSYNGSPSTEIVEAPSPRSWSSRERVKAVTSVSISPNGRFLALGEVSTNWFSVTRMKSNSLRRAITQESWSSQLQRTHLPIFRSPYSLNIHLASVRLLGARTHNTWQP